jgi:hypothetical protein
MNYPLGYSWSKIIFCSDCSRAAGQQKSFWTITSLTAQLIFLDPVNSFLGMVC